MGRDILCSTGRHHGRVPLIARVAAGLCLGRPGEPARPRRGAAARAAAGLAALSLAASPAAGAGPEAAAPRREQRGGPLALGIVVTATTILGFAAAALVAERLRLANRALRGREEDLTRQTAQFDAALAAMSQGLCLFDPAGRLVIANRRVREIYRLGPDDLAVGDTLEEVLRALCPTQGERDALAAFHGGAGRSGPSPLYHQAVAPDRIVAISHAQVADGGFLATYEEVTERCRAEAALRASAAALRASEERLAFALDSGTDGHWDWNLASGEIWFSDRWLAMLGYAPGELAGTRESWEQLCHPEDRPRVLRQLAAHLEGREPAFVCEQRLRHRNGTYAWILARGRVMRRSPAGAPLTMVGTHLDITHRKEAEARAAHLASHDPLTGLPNRLLFQERLARHLAETRSRGVPCAVLCLDLDGFKAVNDSLGHPIGDALLREVADRIRATLRASDTVARLGGDEFAVLLPGHQPRERSGRVAERLIDAVREPLRLKEMQVVVGVSIGIAVAPEDGLDEDDLIRRADVALYRAKGGGRNTYRFHEAEAAQDRLRAAG
ncbi:diguanylate cyclase with PAS/PAC sensor [Methylobacterium sp. 4-46]|uniref:diguanylate cyclase domain-containing protein n=1 Tax=unclassified Methylobacterium TaxID=2615210 RepID=UPI000165C9C7|nr:MULTISPECIES: diguanylate cyclase [Methylobacterium]ACA16664.1 diguanylate cyclase with PAS/PAC sensor [Methylobacterium sp. 4-46]WFT82366.1 diguanylate cyclase [Methylobacterium nodulans]